MITPKKKFMLWSNSLQYLNFQILMLHICKNYYYNFWYFIRGLKWYSNFVSNQTVNKFIKLKEALDLWDIWRITNTKNWLKILILNKTAAAIHQRDETENTQIRMAQVYENFFKMFFSIRIKPMATRKDWKV